MKLSKVTPCPYCATPLEEVNLALVFAASGKSLEAIAISCPHCHIDIQIMANELVDMTVQEVMTQLDKS